MACVGNAERGGFIQYPGCFVAARRDSGKRLSGEGAGVSLAFGFVSERAVAGLPSGQDIFLLLGFRMSFAARSPCCRFLYVIPVFVCDIVSSARWRFFHVCFIKCD